MKIMKIMKDVNFFSIAMMLAPFVLAMFLVVYVFEA